MCGKSSGKGQPTNARHAAEQNEARHLLDTLTPREFEVMQLVITGMLNKQVGLELGMAEKTVKVHRGRVTQKLGVASVAELVRLAQKAGVLAYRISIRRRSDSHFPARCYSKRRMWRISRRCSATILTQTLRVPILWEMRIRIGRRSHRGFVPHNLLISQLRVEVRRHVLQEFIFDSRFADL
jgi:DNA-binding CsgD family transcriptional regulator